MEERKSDKNHDPGASEKMNRGTGLKEYFEGEWSFKRTIFCSDDQSPYAIADGSASFSPFGEEKLIYTEAGKLSLRASGQTFPFSRSFIYFFNEDQVEIYFNDGPNSGQLYQSYRAEGGHRTLSPIAGHTCREDCYNSIYRMLSTVEFKLETVIRGPKKEFKIETHSKKN